MGKPTDILKTYQINNPLETFPGLTIDDLNKYLPAIQTAEDISMAPDNMKEGLYLTKCIDGLKAIPDETIDLIIAAPPKDNWDTSSDFDQSKTLQEYYQWNQTWLNESRRILKNTGAIYILSPWQYSGMYHSLLSNFFQVQTRIAWRNSKLVNKSKIWKEETSDIWFATKTDEFLFNQNPIGINTIVNNEIDKRESNFWMDISKNIQEGSIYPKKLFTKILEASSFKLNWVLDPFMGFGDIGIACKKYGRRYIGFGVNKDYVLLSMKRIDNS